MTYDWDGRRTRRVLLFKMMTAVALGLSVPLVAALWKHRMIQIGRDPANVRTQHSTHYIVIGPNLERNRKWPETIFPL